ncbi:hypothetical protein [Kordiimonas sp.]|uniref:hypothetical protein n=1 Tax=Kordiimonas sp. TaxID=1970157 RepID=UPI003A946CAC
MPRLHHFTPAKLAAALFIIAGLMLQPLMGASPVAAFDDVKKIKAPKAKKRPSLSYRPNSVRGALKYNARVGILTLRDARVMKFFGGTDDFFAEPAPQAIGDNLYFEMKSSRLFKSTKRIDWTPGTELSNTQLAQIAKQNGVDLIFVADLQAFNMLREKMVLEKKGVDYKIIVRFGLFGQLIDPGTGKILWAEQVSREFSGLNSTGRIKPYDYSGNALQAMQAGFDDVKKYIRATGLEYRP